MSMGSMEPTVRAVVDTEPEFQGRERQRAALCMCIGSDTFKLLCSLCSPLKPEECDYEDLESKLDDHVWCEEIGFLRTVPILLLQTGRK